MVTYILVYMLIDQSYYNYMYYSYVRMRNKLYTAYKCGHNSDIKNNTNWSQDVLHCAFCKDVHLVGNCKIFNKDLGVTITSCNSEQISCYDVLFINHLLYYLVNSTWADVINKWQKMSLVQLSLQREEIVMMWPALLLTQNKTKNDIFTWISTAEL